MSALSEQARSRAKSKVERLTSAKGGQVDASNWRERTDEMGDVQTGERPISRRQFKRGGKVAGAMAAARADRKPRKSGGSALTADSLINRNVKDANEERDGSKHIGGMRKGGRTGKALGGPMQMPAAAAPAAGGAMVAAPPMRAFKDGGKVHGGDCKCAKCSGGRVGRKEGGAINDGTRPTGGRLARKGGGRTKKGMNVNIIIAPQGGGQKPPMPMPGAPPGGPVGLHQAAPPPMAPPGAGAPMGPGAGMPPPMARKSGGRAYPIESGAGGGLGRLEKIKAYG
jgi:hypothetical protein